MSNTQKNIYYMVGEIIEKIKFDLERRPKNYKEDKEILLDPYSTPWDIVKSINTTSGGNFTSFEFIQVEPLSNMFDLSDL